MITPKEAAEAMFYTVAILGPISTDEAVKDCVRQWGRENESRFRHSLPALYAAGRIVFVGRINGASAWLAR